jgi:hypothetical protein
MKNTIENVKITPEMAYEILSATDHEYQRPLRKGWVDFLAKEIKAGNFLSNNIALCVNGDEKKYLVNGQHTLNAIFESGIAITLPIQTFYVQNKDDIASIYSRFDKQHKRTRADTFRAFDMETKLEMSYTAVNHYGACAYFILNNFSRNVDRELVSEREVMDFMHEWKPYAKQYFASIELAGSLRVPLERREIFSIGLMTSRHSRQADDFWHYVVTDDGLYVGDPRKTLHNWLSESGVGGGNVGYTRKKRIVRTSESMRCVVAAWNAFIEGRKLKILSIKNPSLPFTIKDTPYKNLI